MTDVKRYHSALITEVVEECRSRLPQFVRAEDYNRSQSLLECAQGDLRTSEQIRERVTAERDQLQRHLDDRGQEVDRMRRALQKIAHPHDCGCLPCHGDCTSKLSLEITVDAHRDIASEALENKA